MSLFDRVGMWIALFPRVIGFLVVLIIVIASAAEMIGHVMAQHAETSPTSIQLDSREHLVLMRRIAAAQERQADALAQMVRNCK